MEEAEIVHEIPKPTMPRMQYPWDVWLDGQTRRLEPGRHFNETISPYSFIATARQQGKKHGKKVEAHVRQGDVYLTAVTAE